MKVDVTKTYTKDTFYTLVPINRLLRIIGLSNIYSKGCHLAESGSILKTLIYITFHGFTNVFFLYHKSKSFQGNPQNGLVKYADVVDIIYWCSYFEYVIDMGFVFKYGREALLKYFKDFDRIDSVLGLPHYDEIRKNLTNCLIISFSVSLSILIGNYTVWLCVLGWKLPTLYAVDYFYFIINMLGVMDIISHVIQVEYRLKLILDLLQDYNIPVSANTNPDNSVICILDTNNQPLDTLITLCYTKYLETGWFSRCYIQLLDQVAFINTSYGFRVLMYCTTLLINMIILLNLSFRILNGTMMTHYGFGPLRLFASISSTLRALNYGVIVTLLMHRCEKTYRQYEKILETIDSILASKKEYVDLKTNLLEFRNLLITRPVKFHAAKFFTMNYTLLVSLSSVIVTYTIIILQSMQ